MKRVYKTPGVRVIDLEGETMLAGSIDDGSDVTMSDGAAEEQWTQKKEKPNVWGREGIWK